MNHLVIVRHGQTEWPNRFTGWTDIDITKEGEEMTKKYALRIKEKGIVFDLAYTSVLKRAYKTIEIVLRTINQEKVPIIKDWHLNERHYGALQTLNKAEMVKKYGEEQVNLWRRSYDVPPPKVSEDDPRHPKNDPKYKNIDPRILPAGESLKDTYYRVIPYFQKEIKKKLLQGKNILLSSHHNALRAIVKYLDNITDEAIIHLNIPYCIPLVYEYENGRKINKYYLGNDEEVNQIIDAIKNQTK